MAKALSRDDIIQVLFASDFFDINPALQALEPVLTKCRQAYRDSHVDCCGSRRETMYPAVALLFHMLQQLKESDPAATRTFCAFMADKKGFDSAEFTIYYRGSKTGKPTILAIP
jgi:hypothetical protein